MSSLHTIFENEDQAFEEEETEQAVVGQRVVVEKDGCTRAGTLVTVPPHGTLRVAVEGVAGEAGGAPLSLHAFCLLVGYKAKQKDLALAKYIKLGEQTLADVLEAQKKGKDGLSQLLQSYNVISVDDVASFGIQGKPLKHPRYAYRVCRVNEDISDGLKLPDNLQCLRNARGLKAATYFFNLTDHVWFGSRLTKRKPFISATWDLKQALWWAFGGNLKVVAIDTAKLGDRCLWWDIGSTHSCHSELLYSPMARHFASSSAEVVFDNDIPAEACEVLTITWEARALGNSKRITLDTTMPKELPKSPSDIEVVKVLQGTTFPLHVKFKASQAEAGPSQEASQDQSAAAEPSSQSGKGTRRRKSNPPPEETFVLKRGGYRHLDPWHASMEYLALQMYDAGDVQVPAAALYPIKVTVQGQHAMTVPMNMLLTRYIEGVSFKQQLHTLAGDEAAQKALKDLVRPGVVMDLALCNMDVCGPDYSNLIVVTKGRSQKVYRVDVGGSSFFNPDGSRKEDKLFFGTKASVEESIKVFTVKPTKTKAAGFSKFSRSPLSSYNGRGLRTGTPAQGAVLEAWDANRAIFGGTTMGYASLAQLARQTLQEGAFERSIDRACSGMHDSSCIAAATTVLKRLKAMAGLDAVNTPLRALASSSAARGTKRLLEAGPRSGPSSSGDSSSQASGSGVAVSEPKRPRPPLSGLAPPAPAVAAQPKEIKIINVRGLKDSKKEELLQEGFEIINVTSKSGDSRWKKLSPFYPHGGIPVPGSPGAHSASVEGLWQGLKVFECEGVDTSKFANATERNLKRPASKEGTKRRNGKKPGRGEVLHHWWGPLPSSGAMGPLEQLSYIDARRRLYVPAYTWVLDNKAKPLVRELAQKACNTKIALVDYFVNDDVDDDSTPLSHAALLRTYILDNFQSLVGGA